MAGVIPSLSLSTQLDKNGNLLNGGLLQFYAANTTTPQSVYSDTDLTLALPNPITLDASGRVPEFYCADGNIRARLTDKAGVVQFDAKNLLVIGPSSGSGGGGGGVDATTIFQTGDVMWLDQSGVRSGWVRDNGRTIGSATSGAGERANSDCQPLFEFLWNTYSDTICPVPLGRGVSATADWSANKQITLPDKRGYSPIGLDDMGNSAASRLTGVPVGTGSVIAAGSLLGEATHTLTAAESADDITYTSAVTDPQHDHTYAVATTGGGSIAGNFSTPTGSHGTTDKASTGITVATTSDAGGGAHNNTPLVVTGSFFRKL